MGGYWEIAWRLLRGCWDAWVDFFLNIYKSWRAGRLLGGFLRGRWEARVDFFKSWRLGSCWKVVERLLS